MRILILTNFFPPYELGGQGKSCKQVVEGLRGRGHEISVLTSRHGLDNHSKDVGDGIFRLLHLEMDLVPYRNSVTFFTQRKRDETGNLSVLTELSREYHPELVFIWGMWNLHRSLPFTAEKLHPGRVVYRFAEYWPTLPSQFELYWREPGRNPVSRVSKKILGSFALSMIEEDQYTKELKFEHCICVSAGTRDTLVEAGVPVQDAKIIYTGLDPDLYRGFKEFDSPTRDRIKLFYAGRITHEKGLQSLIDAISLIRLNNPEKIVTLDIAGNGSSDYISTLNRSIQDGGNSDRVRFLGVLPAEEMPSVYLDYDVLVVPSIWPEPLARVVLEGMLAGLVVVATPVGGTTEVIQDGINGILFKAGDPEDLASQIVRLAEDPDLCRSISREARATILENFSKERMLDEIEAYLGEVLEGASVATPLGD